MKTLFIMLDGVCKVQLMYNIYTRYKVHAASSSDTCITRLRVTVGVVVMVVGRSNLEVCTR